MLCLAPRALQYPRLLTICHSVSVARATGPCTTKIFEGSRSDQIRSNQIRSDQIRSDQIRLRAPITLKTEGPCNNYVHSHKFRIPKQRLDLRECARRRAGRLAEASYEARYQESKTMPSKIKINRARARSDANSSGSNLLTG